MYSQIGDEVFKTSTKELKRDLYVIADIDPGTLLTLNESSIVELKYLAREAVKFNVLKIEGSVIKWAKNGRKVTVVPVDETPYTAIANFFLTDDGHEAKVKVEELIDKI